MKLHEFQAKLLLNNAGIPVPAGLICHNPLDVLQASDKIGCPVVLKAQVHAGGRGKAGGIRFAKTPQEALDISSEMFGTCLKTAQSQSRAINKILVEPVAQISKEIYLAIIVDRNTEKLAIIFSEEGGVEIEDLARANPSAIKKIFFNPFIGLSSFQVNQLLAKASLELSIKQKLVDIISRCVSLFMSHDLSLLEINPLALLKDGQLVALDCKIAVDDNSLFRQSFLARFEDYNELDPMELRAKRARLSYVQLDGNIGCLVNGAGLAMATMDAIVQAGGKPSNFLDIGGGVTEEGILEALSLLLDDSKAQVLFVNIFGGIVKCDLVASSVISAYRQSSVRKPCVIRLIGTNDKLAQAIFSNSEFQFRFVNSMEEGAALAVQLANR